MQPNKSERPITFETNNATNLTKMSTTIGLGKHQLLDDEGISPHN